MSDFFSRKDSARQKAPCYSFAFYASKRTLSLLCMRSHFVFLMQCCNAPCLSKDLLQRYGCDIPRLLLLLVHHSFFCKKFWPVLLGSHSCRAAPDWAGRFPPPLTPCRDCLLLNPGASPCAMFSGSKTLWAACHLIHLITIVVLDFT